MKFATSTETGAMASDCATMTSVSSSEVVLRTRSGSARTAPTKMPSMVRRSSVPPGWNTQSWAASCRAGPPTAGQRMAAAHDQAGLLDADHLALEQTRIEVVGNARDDEIVARGEQFARQHDAGVDLDVDLDARMALADPPDRRHGELDRRRRDGAQEDRATLAAFQVGDLAVDLAHLEQHRAGAAR